MNTVRVAFLLVELLGSGDAPESYLGIHTALPAFLDDTELADPELAPGLTITEVVENSPAMQAGVRVGDRLLRLGGETPRTPAHADALVARMPVGSRVGVAVRRGDEVLELEATTVRRLAPREAPAKAYFIDGRCFGLALATLDTTESLRRGLGPGDGVRVERLLRRSPVRGSGLQPRDIIVAIDAARVHGKDDYLAITRRISPGSRRVLHVLRAGRSLSIRVKTFRPESYVHRISIPLLLSYEDVPRREETTLRVLLGLFRYRRREAQSTYRFFWIISASVGTNEELEEVVP